MKIKSSLFFVILILFLNSTNSYSQTYRVFNLNTEEYPILSINFTDYYNRTDTVDFNDVNIYEGNEQAKVIEFKPASTSFQPTSITIVLDISGSMLGERLGILKEATKEFINFLPLDRCEVAIATFNSQIQLNCDFTHNKQRLFNTIDSIQANGGTNYTVAFLESQTGIIDITKQAQFKKHVIFFTDGLSSVNTDEVISAANNYDITINCLTIKLRIPRVLKDISTATGGDYYEKLIQKEEIESIYTKIFDKIQEKNHGLIKWEAIKTCNQKVNLKIKINGKITRLTYNIPDRAIGNITTEPSALFFSHNNLLEAENKSLVIHPNTQKLTIENIYSKDPSKFKFEKLDFPIELNDSESKTINFIYEPINNLYTFDQYTIKTKECPDIKIDAYGGSKNKLEIISPKLGDTLIAGSEAIISWQGVSKSTNVELSYSINNNKEWIPIGMDQEYNYNWNVPNDTGSLVRIKAKCSNELNYNSFNKAKLILNGNSNFISANYNEDGSAIITSNSNGIIKSWKRSDGKEIFEFEKSFRGEAIFYPVLNRALVLSGSQQHIFTNRNGKYIGTFNTKSKRLKSSFMTWKGKEYYSSVTENRNSILWDPVQNRQVINPKINSINEATISYNKEFVASLTSKKVQIWNVKKNKKWLSIKLKDTFQNGIFHQNKSIISLNYIDRIVLYDLTNKKKKLKIDNEKFIRYSPKGEYLVTGDSNNLYLHNLISWERSLSFNKPDFYYFSNDEKMLLTKKNSSIKIFNISDKKIVFEDSIPECTDLKFFPKSSKILVITDRYFSIIDYKRDSLIYTLNYQNDFVNNIEISPDENELLIISENNVLVWEPIDLKEDTISDYFSIISPRPFIKDSLFFSKQLINMRKEISFDDFLINKSNYPLLIKGMFFDQEINTEYSIISDTNAFTIPPKMSQNIEIGFKPRSTGIKKGFLNIVTPTDTLRSFISGSGISLNSIHIVKQIDFGKIPFNTKRDTIIPLFINQNDTIIHIESVHIAQTYKTDFSLLKKVDKTLINKNDTLWISIRFKPKDRGRTSTFLNIKIQGFDTPFNCKLLGESIAKRSVIIKGKTINNFDNTGMHAFVICTDLESKNNIIKVESDLNGVFSFQLNTDRNYSLFAETPGFISSSVNLDLIPPQSSDTIFTEILLTPITSNSFIRLNNVFFEVGSAELNDLSTPDLDRIVNFLKSNTKISIEIHGHTDNQGSIESNLALSESRAVTLMQYLINSGISKSRLSLRSFGESQPVASNNTAEGRKLNRRVEIKILK